MSLCAIPAVQAAASAPNVPPQLTGDALKAAETQRQALFTQMLADPGNVQLALKYAMLSSQVGDLEGAISTLERLVIFAPQVAQLNFQLGILYVRLGAYEQAVADFEAAAAAPDATPEIKTQAAAYIAASNKQVAGDFATGSVSLGARYQTNANGGVSSPTVNLNGIPFQVDPSAMAAPDSNLFMSGSLHASHDLQSQGDRLDLNVNAYSTLQRMRGDLNTLSGEAELGPVFNLERYSIKNATLGVYGILDAVGLGGVPYLYSLGAGSVVTFNPSVTTTFHSRVEYRYETYLNSALRPTIADQTGGRTRATQDVAFGANEWLSFYGSVYGERKDARVAMRADWEAGGAVGTRLSLGHGDTGPTTVDLSVGAAARLFDANDPGISPDRRMDKVVYAQGTLTMPFKGGFSGSLGVLYTKQVSNYDIDTYDDLSVSAALTKGF